MSHVKAIYPARIGNYEVKIQVEGSSEADIFKGLSFYSANLPTKCGNCEGGDLFPQHAVRKGYDFYSIVCRTCRWELKYGQAKDTPGKLFPKEWEQPYDGRG